MSEKEGFRPEDGLEPVISLVPRLCYGLSCVAVVLLDSEKYRESFTRDEAVEWLCHQENQNQPLARSLAETIVREKL